ILVVGYFGIASGFYWLMQPTVVKNNGLAGYQPPAATVISAKPVLPPPAAPPLAALPPAPAIPAAARAATNKDKEAAKREARTATPRVARERNPMLDYASSQRRQGGWGQQGGWGHQGSWGQQGGGWGGGFSSQNYSSQGGRRWF